MKIEKLHTMDFMGIPGKKVWEFRENLCRRTDRHC